MKTLDEISWQVTEEEYRADPALSYSSLAKYEREGFHKIPHLSDKLETPSLIFGSAVDAIITGGMKEFDERFLVCDYNITDGGMNVCRTLASMYADQYTNFADIPQELVSRAAQEAGFWKDPKWDKKRYNEVLKTGDVDKYYYILTHATKTVIDRQTYDEIIATVSALKTAPASKWYFQDNTPFDDVQRYYQLKYKGELGGVEYRCMMDLAIVDYKNKIIYPCDLKTSGHFEDEFPQSFIKWSYAIQARLYWRLMRQAMDKDEFFKDFELKDFTFIVVNKNSLTPLTWTFPLTQQIGNITVGKHNQIELRDPQVIGAELHTYLEKEHKVPMDISESATNDLLTQLNKL